MNKYPRLAIDLPDDDFARITGASGTRSKTGTPKPWHRGVTGNRTHCVT